jgi:biopolymer transport protein ExbD
MYILKTLVVTIVTASFIGCQKDQTAEPQMKTLKVKVSGAGEITADGQAMSLEQLSAKMADLKKVDGAVLYHRENPEGKPHPNAMKVMKLIVDHKLPIRLCAKPDFSDAVDDNGDSHTVKK